MRSDIAEERAEAVRSTQALFRDEMLDVRPTIPALTMALFDPSEKVRLPALEVIELLADMGVDIGMAVPISSGNASGRRWRSVE